MLFQENMRDCLLNPSISSFSLTPRSLLTNISLFYLSTNKFSPNSEESVSKHGYKLLPKKACSGFRLTCSISIILSSSSAASGWH